MDGATNSSAVSKHKVLRERDSGQRLETWGCELEVLLRQRPTLRGCQSWLEVGNTLKGDGRRNGDEMEEQPAT